MKKNKKGFTIVELVIVIGVIAILSAILIPTFVSLTNKANDARAKQEVADAYTEYLIDAGDGYVGDGTSVVLELKLQSEVEIKRGEEYFEYTVKDGWKVKNPNALHDGYTNPEGASYNGGCEIYYAAA